MVTREYIALQATVGCHHQLLFQSNLGSFLIAKLCHFNVFDAEAVGLVSSPFDGDTVVQVGP